MDYAALKSEIQADPAAMGYAPLVASGSDGGIADLMNSPTSPGAATISLNQVAREKLLPLLLIMTKNASTLADANKKSRWMQVASMFLASDSIPAMQGPVTATFSDA